ncbi:small myristoylated protein-1 [Trypanosoma conorhini]|uniref:Small myristoylated protein-1 n=1 Tax=Trypanosoma conorhini TaxID=83891 RepID=A0A422PP62_9TRYP|nr:small myristoylated protein-1 [Trypanosoma conorhini]RNF19508.1 small myristoylated protein-1 [Trypanosoma conorhini]
MGCGYSVYSTSGDIIFKHRGPKKGARKVIKMFEKENGLLFRLEMNGGQWAFYNDTKEYEFYVQYVFEDGSEVEPLGDATLTEMEDGTTIVETTVYPLETQMFLSGDITGGHGRIEARPLSERYRREKLKIKIARGS